jgi:hypothetical protein
MCIGIFNIITSIELPSGNVYWDFKYESNQIINKCVHVTNNIAYLFSESLLFIIKSIKRRINGRGKIPIHITRWKF